MTKGDEDREIAGILEEIGAELQRARSRFGPMRSAHEGIAVIEEEFLELREAIFKKKWDATDSTGAYAKEIAHIRVEAIQLAAMATRFVFDVVP